jgi:signal transduction histidine kinase/ActR/RegA family two-component response regulator
MGMGLDQDIGQGSISLRRALAIALALLAALGLIALTVFVTNSNKQRDDALAAQRKSFEIIILTRSLENQMNRAESALGRYVVSLEETPGRQYVDEWRRAGLSIARLRQVTRDDPLQSRLTSRLAGIYEKRGALLSAAALHIRYDQKMQGLRAYHDAALDPTAPALTRSVDQIVANENRQLDQRISAASQTLERSNQAAKALLTFAVIILMGAALLGYSAIQALAERRASRQDADEAARRTEELEDAVAERTLELRRANEALMAEAAEREAAEAKLRQVQKMEAVGQLTGGIAHDFNNMLAVVIGGLELAKRRLQEDRAEAGRHLDNAMEGASRAAALTRRLLAFARAEPLLPEAVAPVALIEGMTELLDRTLGERVTVRTQFQEASWAVWVDKHQLENALLNLAVNARDAMDGEGVLTIETGARAIAEDEFGSVRAGDYVVISVSDTGAGMDQATLDRVFEPFFTTKPVGKGTGLGLSQIFGFVRQSQGEIVIASEEGRGTTVSILLPRFTGAERPTSVSPADPVWDVSPIAHEEHAAILVVEDDPRVLNATVEALAELGHHPIPCAAPEQALALLDEAPEVRLVITDVVMPGTSGPELVAAIRPLHPHVGVLFVTGFAGDVDEASAFAGYDVLRKPFTIGALAKAVDAALSRSSGPPPFATAAAAE